jgi:hypothetical protein
VITFRWIEVPGFKGLGKVVLIVYGPLVSLIREDRRIIIVPVDDSLTRLANAKIPRLAEYLSRNQRGAFRIKNLATSPAVMLAPKGRK